ncbi:MAG: oligopeptide transporter, OPT family [Candidatus Zixiibacteriota bacterium]|nr:MAG: oligopeptide transporter, OPT family [candidate division Zixibacteria bacterium]
MEEPEYKPYISHDKKLPEFTWKSIIIGTVLGIVFAWANAYVGLISGLTISASIPVSVMSVALFAFLHKFFKARRGSPLETNMSQTIGSAGESLAAGVIFTIPAMFLLGWDQAYGIQVITITIIAAIGGILGVAFMIPLRKFLVKKEHKVLPFPEGTACAEVIKSADIGGTSAKFVFTGLGVGGLIELIKNGFSVFDGLIRVPTLIVNKMVVSLEVNPALLGVGYILRRRISAIMVAGGAVAWIILIPAIAAFGDSWGMFRFLNEQAQATLGAAGVFSIADMNPDQIWNYFIRYIGAGAVAFGGIITLIRSIPTIVESFRLGSKELMAGSDRLERIRTDRDLSIKIVLWISAIVIILLGLAFTFGLEQITAGTSILAAILVVIFAFFFVTVASRIVGLVGSTSSPVSGMTIATLLGTSIIFVAFGLTSGPAKIAALTIGAVVCMAACTSGDVAQDLKTGFLVGATPRKQQMGELIGVLTSAAVLGFTLMMLYNAYGFAGAPSPITGKAELPAPQATLMSLVVKGVMDQNIPWILVGAGAVIAMIFEFFKVPSLPAAVGLYLPLQTTTPIFAGGLLRHYRDKKSGARPTDTDNGVLFSSGLVAGVGVIGILLAIVAIIPAGDIFVLDAMRLPLTSLWAIIPYGNVFSMILAAVIFVILMIMLNRIARPAKD